MGVRRCLWPGWRAGKEEFVCWHNGCPEGLPFSRERCWAQNTPGTGSPQEVMIPRDSVCQRDSPCQRDSLCQLLGSSRHLVALSSQTLPGAKVTNTGKSCKISVPPPSCTCAGVWTQVEVVPGRSQRGDREVTVSRLVRHNLPHPVKILCPP